MELPRALTSCNSSKPTDSQVTFHSEAMLADSQIWPWFAAPSPYMAKATGVSSPAGVEYLLANASPVPTGTCAPTMPALLFVRKMMRTERYLQEGHFAPVLPVRSTNEAPKNATSLRVLVVNPDPHANDSISRLR